MRSARALLRANRRGQIGYSWRPSPQITIASADPTASFSGLGGTFYAINGRFIQGQFKPNYPAGNLQETLLKSVDDISFFPAFTLPAKTGQMSVWTESNYLALTGAYENGGAFFISTTDGTNFLTQNYTPPVSAWAAAFADGPSLARANQTWILSKFGGSPTYATTDFLTFTQADTLLATFTAKSGVFLGFDLNYNLVRSTNGSTWTSVAGFNDSENWSITATSTAFYLIRTTTVPGVGSNFANLLRSVDGYNWETCFLPAAVYGITLQNFNVTPRAWSGVNNGAGTFVLTLYPLDQTFPIRSFFSSNGNVFSEITYELGKVVPMHFRPDTNLTGQSTQYLYTFGVFQGVGNYYKSP